MKSDQNDVQKIERVAKIALVLSLIGACIIGFFLGHTHYLNLPAADGMSLVSHDDWDFWGVCFSLPGLIFGFRARRFRPGQWAVAIAALALAADLTGHLLVGMYNLSLGMHLSLGLW